MMKTSSYVDWTTLIWHFEINFKRITIQSFKNFLDFDDKTSIYTLIYSTFDVEITSKMRRLLKLLKSYKNYFDFKNAKTLFEHEDENHIINFVFGTKLSYEPLYTFFKIELNVLKNYLLKNLILNRIREFTSRASTLILFVFKKNDNFQLCIDYKRLNAFIIKNRCWFLFINKTLNRFMKIVYFIKFDFKNIYHWIKICKSDEWMIAFRTCYEHLNIQLYLLSLSTFLLRFKHWSIKFYED